MNNEHKPEQPILDVSKAISEQNMTDALGCYEESAIFVTSPDNISTGPAQIEQALRHFMDLSPTLDVIRTRKVLVNGDLALVGCDWEMKGTDPSGQAVEMQGTNIDIVRRQSDGRWLLVIDNPFGMEI